MPALISTLLSSWSIGPTAITTNSFESSLTLSHFPYSKLTPLKPSCFGVNVLGSLIKKGPCLLNDSSYKALASSIVEGIVTTVPGIDDKYASS